jgi:dihydropteroate synthase
MGVVNVTPDSFHAAGRFPEIEDAVAAAERQVAAGADLVDVGGESTRPGAEPVAGDVELGRVVPLVQALVARRLAVPISIDTYKASVARAAVAAGAALVNDVSGGLLDPEMPAAVAALGVPVIVGHLRGTPRDMARHAAYGDVVAEVRDELAARAAAFLAAGVPREDVLLDPGIGFAKRSEHSRVLLRRLGELRALGFPLVVGVSRKGFVGEALRASGVAHADDTSARLEGSLAAAVLAAAGGAAIVRVHDVAETRRALAVADAVLHGA